jgi:hypothetical protein
MAVIRGLLLLLVASHALADDERAHVNYMLHCQGCHLPNAEGMEGKVPPMKDFVGYFLHSAEGRQFLIRVPGVAQSALGDDELAELMNWLVMTHSAGQLPDSFEPFSAVEVATLRMKPVADPERTRQRLLDDIASDNAVLRAEIAGSR